MANDTQQANNGRSRNNWVFQSIFQIVMVRLLYSLLLRPDNIKDPITGLPPTKYNNYFVHNDVYDIFACVTETKSPPFDVLIEKNTEVIYSRENQIYTHKFNKPFDTSKLIYKAPAQFYSDQNKHLYMSVFLIPHKAYAVKKVPFYKSEFKDGFEGHYVEKSVELTLKKRLLKDTKLNLMNNSDDEYVSDEEFKHWVPRLDIHVVYDTTVHTALHENAYFHSFTKYDDEKVYDPYLFLSQFWVLEEQYVHIKPEQQVR